MRWFCNWKSIHIRYIPGLRRLASVVCEKADSENTESLQVLFDADWQEEAGSMNCQLEIVSLLKPVPGMTVLFL